MSCGNPTQSLADAQIAAMTEAEWAKLRGEFDRATPADENVAETTAAVTEAARAAGPPATGNVTRYMAAGKLIDPITRAQARGMGYTGYLVAEAERGRLTWEGMARELTEAEVKRLRQASAAVLGYLDFIFGPETDVAYTKGTSVTRKAAKRMARCGRIGKLVNRR